LDLVGGRTHRISSDGVSFRIAESVLNSQDSAPDREDSGLSGEQQAPNENAHLRGKVGIFPLFYQGDVQWENRFDGNATARTCVIGSYFTRAPKSRKKAQRENNPTNLSKNGAYRPIHVFLNLWKNLSNTLWRTYASFPIETKSGRYD
jgi:hypothetical protein